MFSGPYNLCLPVVCCPLCDYKWTPGMNDLLGCRYWPATTSCQLLFKFDVFASFEEMKLSSPALSQQVFLRMLEHRALSTGRVRPLFIFPSFFTFQISKSCINQNTTILVSRWVVFVVMPSTEPFENLPSAILRKMICARWSHLNVQHAHQTCWPYLQMATGNIIVSRSPKGQWNHFLILVIDLLTILDFTANTFNFSFKYCFNNLCAISIIFLI